MLPPTLLRKLKDGKGLDKFGEVHETVDWEKGHSGQCVHNSCQLTISSERKLKQAQQRQKKREFKGPVSHFSGKFQN